MLRYSIELTTWSGVLTSLDQRVASLQYWWSGSEPGLWDAANELRQELPIYYRF